MNADCGPDCQAALERLEAFLDGELPVSAIEQISVHLAACFPCADRADFEADLRALVRRGCSESAPPTLLARVRAHLQAGSPTGPTEM